MKFIPYEPKHFNLIHKWHTDEEISQKVGYEKKPTEEETRKLLITWLSDNNRILFLVEHLDKIVGYVTLSEINRLYETATLHTTVGEKEFLHQKSCVGIMDGILKYAFNELKLHRVTTYVMSNNPKLIMTAKKYGWIQEGILKDFIKFNGQRLNYYVFRLLKSEFRKRGDLCQQSL